MPITPLPVPPNKYSDNPQQFSDKALAWTNALATFQTEANQQATDINADKVAAAASASTATTKASEAAASAATALAAPGTSATSTTSVAIGLGSKSLTIQTAKSLVAGMSVKITSSATPTTYMAGVITAYTSGTGALVVNVNYFEGTGTLASWNVSLAAPVVPPVVRVVANEAALPTGIADGELATTIDLAKIWIRKSGAWKKFGGGLEFGAQLSSSFTAEVGYRYPIFPSALGLIVTLPLSPIHGDMVGVMDAGSNFHTYPITIARNGKAIMLLSEDLVVSTRNASFTLIYNSTATSWHIVEAAVV